MHNALNLGTLHLAAKDLLVQLAAKDSPGNWKILFLSLVPTVIKMMQIDDTYDLSMYT